MISLKGEELDKSTSSEVQPGLEAAPRPLHPILPELPLGRGQGHGGRGAHPAPDQRGGTPQLRGPLGGAGRR